MNRARSKNRKLYGPVTMKVVVAGLVVWMAISAAGGYVESQGFKSSWYLLALKNQGLDFAYVGMLTCAILVIFQCRSKRINDRKFYAKWGPLSISLCWLLDGWLIELYQTMHAHGDLRDVLAESIGWIAAMAPITVAQYWDHRTKAAPRTTANAPVGTRS